MNIPIAPEIEQLVHGIYAGGAYASEADVLADAHVILAERATTIEVKLDHYLRGLEVAQQELGGSYIAEKDGHCWEIWATRPNMRARFGVAESWRRSDRRIKRLSITPNCCTLIQRMIRAFGTSCCRY